MIINLKSQTNLSGLYVVYEGSTNLEKKGNYGISHLMEHLMCKTFFHMIQDFDRDGIQWNAYTSSNEIVFYMTGLDEVSYYGTVVGLACGGSSDSEYTARLLIVEYIYIY
jgi:hypothetical protein